MPNQEAHRRFLRFTYQVPVLVRHSENRTKVFGRMERLGRGGCSLRAPGPVLGGEKLEVEICLGGGALRAEARVVYQRRMPEGNWELGLEFVTVHPADEPLLEIALQEARGDFSN